MVLKQATELVKRWMYEFEVPMDRDEKTVELYSNLIQEELKELEAEFENGACENEFKESIDLLWVTLGKIYALGYSPSDVAEGLRLVYNSNMSKLCNTEIEAIDYTNENPDTSYKRTDSGKYLVFNVKTNKILKGPNYESPTFDSQKS